MDLTWKEIENIRLDLFALPDQVVNVHCRPIFIDSNKCYLETKSPAVLPALEAALSNKFDIEKADKYVIVSVKNKEKNAVPSAVGVAVVPVESE